MHFDISHFEKKHDILTEYSGYLVGISLDDAKAVLNNKAYTLVVKQRIGDFVGKGETLAVLYHHPDTNCTEEQNEKLQKLFGLESKRYALRDYRYAIQKIADVALRAVSPGINDPNTAISFIHSLGLLTGRLATIEGVYDSVHIENEEGLHLDIIIENYSFKNDLFNTFVQITQYGKNDVTVVLALLEAIRRAMLTSADVNRAHLLDLAQYVFDSTKESALLPFDRAQLEARLELVMTEFVRG